MARAGTLEKCQNAAGRIYYRGKVRLRDGTLARITIDPPKCFDQKASRHHVEWAQEDEDTNGTIWKAKQEAAAAREAVTGTGTSTARTPIGVYKARFFKARRASGRVEDVESEEGRLKHLAALDATPMGELTTPAYRAAILQVRDHAKKLDGSPLAPRTIIHVHRTFALMLRTAVAEGVVQVNPCVLLPGDLPAKKDKDPKWRKTARFSRAELRALIADERIPEDRRVFWAVMFLGSTRFGEAAALRWSDYDATTRPLGRLTIEKSYSTKKRREKDTKTEVPRDMPVLPLLASILATWKASGWQALMGREPKPDDLIVPSREGRNRNVNHMLRRFKQDCERIGLRARRQHDTRRTFISLAREGGAGDLLKWCTHGAPGEIIDQYTTPSWEKLCAEVQCVKLDTEPTNDEEAEAVTASASVSVVHQLDHLAANYSESLRGGRDSNPRPPA